MHRFHSFIKTLGLMILLGVAQSSLTAQDNQALVVFAASSLTDAFEKIAIAFETEHPGVDVQFNFGGSSTLAAQLAEGVAADVFASANAAQMNVVCEAGRILSEPVNFARNRLVLALPADNPAAIETLHDLANPGVKLILAAPGVPVREYTETMLDRLSVDPEYGDGYRSSVLANLVSEEENVRQVVAKLALGEADAGIVYLSDITPDIAESLITITVPDEFNTRASYPVAITTEGEQPELARMFIDYMLSADGQDVLVKWGFLGVIKSDVTGVTPESGTAEPTPEATPHDPFPAC